MATLLSSGCLSILLRQDNNWDLRNYHLYSAWALLNGRAGMDIAAAGIQSFFNPLLDLPYYMLAVKWLPDAPAAVAFLAGAFDVFNYLWPIAIIAGGAYLIYRAMRK